MLLKGGILLSFQVVSREMINCFLVLTSETQGDILKESLVDLL